MNTNSTTLVGNLTRDPELRFSQAGTPVCTLGIAVNSRKKTGVDSWEDEPHFFNLVAIGSLADNAAETLTKGMRVVATGSLRYHQWEKDGEKRSSVEIFLEDIAPSLRWASAVVTRNEKSEGGGSVALTGESWAT